MKDIREAALRDAIRQVIYHLDERIHSARPASQCRTDLVVALEALELRARQTLREILVDG